MPKRNSDGMLVNKAKGNLIYRYSIFSNIKFLISNIRKSDRAFMPNLILWCVTSATVELIWSFFNRDIVNLVLGEGEKTSLLLSMAGMIAIILIAKLIWAISSIKVNHRGRRNISRSFWKMLYVKQCDTDCENLENPETKDKFLKAKNASGNFSDFVERLSKALMEGLTIFGWSGILCTLSPWLVLIIIAPTVGYFYAVRYKIKWYSDREDKWTPTDRQLDYVKNISGDFQNAKDVRIYNMDNWFIKTMKTLLDKRLWWYKKQGNMEFKNGFIMLAIVALRDLAAYGFIVYKVIGGQMTPGDFLLYFSSISSLADNFYSILNNIGNIRWMTIQVSWFREFLDIPDKSNRGKGKPLPTDSFDIRFENVSYRYGGAESDTLKNLSFTIKSGEKIAIVGNNGAGKTTLIKLLCGIYRRTGGEIYINDIPIDDYNRDELYTLYAAVFQDIRVIPSTLAENITLSEKHDGEALNYALLHSGIKEKTDSLPDGINTYLVRSVYDNAIDLSGGELQKLALARALYKQKTKKSKILLLDEPTAALDPLAEQNMYLEYAKFTKGKTSVFISHRLASTQFCDRIFFLKNGEITETGTHRELLEKGGEYKEIFEIQSQYYKDEERREHNEQLAKAFL